MRLHQGHPCDSLHCYTAVQPCVGWLHPAPAGWSADAVGTLQCSAACSARIRGQGFEPDEGTELPSPKSILVQC